MWPSTMSSALIGNGMANALQPQPQSVSAMMAAAPQAPRSSSGIPGLLDPRLHDVLSRLAGEARAKGISLGFDGPVAGFRTAAQQEALRGINPKAAKGLSFHETGQAIDMHVMGQPSNSPSTLWAGDRFVDIAKSLGYHARAGQNFDNVDYGHVDLGERGLPMIGSYQRDPRTALPNVAGGYVSAPAIRSPSLANMAYRAAGPAQSPPMAGVGYRGAGPVRGDSGNKNTGSGGNQGGAAKGGVGPKGRQGAR